MRDWRGTEINVDDTVLYFVKNPADIVEGRVAGITPTGRVRVEIIRRRTGKTNAPLTDQLETQVVPHNLTVATVADSDKPLHRFLVMNARL